VIASIFFIGLMGMILDQILAGFTKLVTYQE
jgi:ABC-type nitrate/sulfonate/bicarbonate transport system permease component